MRIQYPIQLHYINSPVLNQKLQDVQTNNVWLSYRDNSRQKKLVLRGSRCQTVAKASKTAIMSMFKELKETTLKRKYNDNF